LKNKKTLNFKNLKTFLVENDLMKTFYILPNLKFESPPQWKIQLFEKEENCQNLQVAVIKFSFENYQNQIFFTTTRAALYNNIEKKILIPSTDCPLNENYILYYYINNDCKKMI
jgi:hypothetical protein